MVPNDRASNGKASFQVKVGHSTIRVESHSADEAIRQARQELSLDMPGMWDVIYAMGQDRFEVDRIQE